MHIYARREDTGKKVLVAIQCDGCGKEIKPNPNINNSGWKRTWYYVFARPDLSYKNDWCEECEENK